jgi:2-keto-4-pentenoate hydratase/2-oxohepta-3-ene-1,7-dioic acid hydratase in catechol pathway
MRLANLDGRATLVTDGGGVDIATASEGRFGPDLPAVYAAWTDFRKAVTELDCSAPEPIDDARLGPPSPMPRQTFGIGVNYRAHAAETGATLPSIPATFTKFPTCITGPFAEVALPSDRVDWEVELVVIVGETARSVPEAEGWSHVAGLTIGQDLSERVVQRAAGAQFSLGKSYPGFGPTGPWLVTPDALEDPDDLGLRCSIDGVVKQDARTDDLVFTVPRLIAELSAIVTLLPGDVIFTGTPSGVGVARQPQEFLQPGQVIESWIEGIGTMRTSVVAR